MTFKKVFQSKSFNVDYFIIFLSSFVAVFFCIGIYLLATNFYNRLMEDIHSHFSQVVRTLKDSYCQTLDLKLSNEEMLLQYWYEKSVFQNGTSKEIQNYLVSKSKKLPRNFQNVFYFDEAGNAYSVFGTVVPIKERDYYAAIFKERRSFYVSNAFVSKLTNDSVYVIAQPVYNERKVLKGALCASVESSTISQLFSNLQGISFGKVAIVDGAGRFVAAQENKWIMENYFSTDPEYESSAEYVKNHEDGNFFYTLAEDGKKLIVVLSSIPRSNWKLAFYIPFENLNKVNIRRKIIDFSVVAIALLCLVGLIVIEYKLMHYFEKNRLIEANYDPVTCIYTRKKFEKEGLKLIIKHRGSDFMLLDTDIRGFRFINQTYGEDTANRILAEVAEYTSDFSDYFNGVCGRGYADHFYTLFPIVTTVSNGLELFKNSLAEINEHFSKYDIKIRPKFGLAFGRYDGTVSSRVFFRRLISNAALAKTTIKDNLQEAFAVCDNAMSEKNKRLHQLESSVEKALKDKEFFVLYQPKTNLDSGKISGAEALVRWNHPELGVISPDEFIPLFEKNGYVIKLDFYVYEEVFKFLDRRIKAGKPVVPVSVNMSRNHDDPEKFMRQFMDIFNKYDIPSKLIQVEILERAYSSSDVLMEVTQLLHDKGFTVAMDDFGSGESSLNMLSKVPVDVLKFDRAFLLGATGSDGKINKGDAGFIEGLIDMSHKLNKETVFEGVETEAQTEFLREANCGYIQGYYYSKPLSESDFDNYIEKHI